MSADNVFLKLYDWWDKASEDQKKALVRKAAIPGFSERDVAATARLSSSNDLRKRLSHFDLYHLANALD